ncbi:hypothetical protein B7P43_G14082, partial [Cryptotermes secundus]
MLLGFHVTLENKQRYILSETFKGNLDLELLLQTMDIPGIEICAEDLLSYRTSMHRLSDTGIHKSVIPFVELTGHKLEEPLVHSFGMAELQLTKHFNLTGKLHSFTSDRRNCMRHESFLPPKGIYSQKFPAVSLSQLVGGFVGSKSQLGSSSRESCQIWDIIFRKLSEFCCAPQPVCCSLFANKNSPTCYNFGNSLHRKIQGPFSQGSVSTLGGSHVIEEDIASPLQDMIIGTLPHPKTVSCNSIRWSSKSAPSVISSSLWNGNKFCPPSDVLKQSYAEVAKSFSVAQQSKQQCSRAPTMKRRNSSSRCGNMLRNSVRQFVCTYHHDSSGKGHKLAVGCTKKSNYSKYKAVNLEQVNKTTENNRDICKSNFERINSGRNIQDMKQDSLRTVSKKVDMDCSQVMYDASTGDSSNCENIRKDKRTKSCTVIKCSSSKGGDMDACTVFTNEVDGGSISVVVCASGKVQTSTSSPESHHCSEESSPRNRSSSDCSTDSDDSFVVFESGVDSDPVTVVLVSDSELSEDETINHLSNDDSDDDYDYDDDDDDD